MTGEKPMSHQEVLSEVHWFLDAGVSPELTAQLLHKRVDNIYQIARRERDERVSKAFGSVAARLTYDPTKERIRRQRVKNRA